MIKRIKIAVIFFVLCGLFYFVSALGYRHVAQAYPGVMQEIQSRESYMQFRLQSGEKVPQGEMQAYYQEIDTLKRRAPAYAQFVDYYYAWVVLSLSFLLVGILILVLPRKRRFVR